MNVQRKDAPITQAPTDEGPGTFEAILSAPTEDRDGETLRPEEWKQPLPAKIPVDIDHEMSVRGTIGSARPFVDDEGNLRIEGTFASTALAQEVRTLMAEGHIDRTSVAYMESKVPAKDGKHRVERELLNAALVCIPSNREAAVLAVRNFKAENVKVGARNSAADAEQIQAIHDSAAALGASCEGTKALEHMRFTLQERDKELDHLARHRKSVAGSLEATQDRVRDALNDAHGGDDIWIWLRATIPGENGTGTCVYEIDSNNSDSETYQQDYTDDGSVVTLTGDPKPVDLMEVIGPDPDENSDGNDTAAPDAAKAADGTAAEFAEQLANRVRALQLTVEADASASIYTD